MNYQQCKIEDFLADERFKRWVIDPDPDSDHFWRSFLQHYPEKTKEIATAKRLITGLEFPEPSKILQPTEDELHSMFDAVFQAPQANQPVNSEISIFIHYGLDSIGFRE